MSDMEILNTEMKGGAPNQGPNAVLCEVVGCGNWTVAIWRVGMPNICGDTYRLKLFLESPESEVRSRGEFRAADVLDLPKLAQVICQTLANDGWLEREMKDDLLCLASALDYIIGESE